MLTRVGGKMAPGKLASAQISAGRNMASTRAQIAKDKGNSAFKTGNWADAIGHYSEAFVADRTNPTIPLNRAAAYLKLSKFQDAERDCTTVLSIDPKNVKAFFRRAQARSALGRCAEAEKDLLDALKLEPSNDSLKLELTSVRNQSAQSDKKLKSKSPQQGPATLPPSVPTTTSQQPSSPAKRRVRNVPIEIVEPDKEEAEAEAEEIKPTDRLSSSDKAQLTSPSPATSQSKPESLLTKVQSRTLSPSANVSAASISPSPSSLPLSSALPSASQNPTPGLATSSKPAPRVGGGLFRADGKFTIIRSPNSPVPTNSNPPQGPALASSQIQIQSVPQTHFAFSRRWNGLKTSRERLSLIHLIPPESLPNLFKDNLAPELLISIIQTFLDISSASPDQDILSLILAYMSTIPSIPRFDTVVLFFSAKEKETVKLLWNNIDPDKKSDCRVLWKGAGEVV